MATVIVCCCPDPAKCHCPDHKADTSKQPSMRACHRSNHVVISPTAPTFVLTEIDFPVPPRIVIAATTELHEPHAPPMPSRPAAPS